MAWYNILGGWQFFFVLGAKIFEGGVPKFFEGRVAKCFWGMVAECFEGMVTKCFRGMVTTFFGGMVAKFFGDWDSKIFWVGWQFFLEWGGKNFEGGAAKYFGCRWQNFCEE